MPSERVDGKYLDVKIPQERSSLLFRREGSDLTSELIAHVLECGEFLLSPLVLRGHRREGLAPGETTTPTSIPMTTSCGVEFMTPPATPGVRLNPAR